MNVMRVPGAQRPFVLAAHAAARRWLGQRTLLARTSVLRRPAWTPLLLRWVRRAVAERSRGAVRAPALPAGAASQFHWHFHLGSLPGSYRERHEARTTVVTSPFQKPVLASRMIQPNVGRLAALVYRRLRDPAGTIDGARAVRAYPQSGTGRTSHKHGWLVPAVAPARWLRGQTDSRRTAPPHIPAGQSFIARAQLPPGAQGVDQARVAGRSALADPRLTLWAKRGPPAAHALESPRQPAVWRRPSEQAWRVSDTAARVTRSSRPTAAPRGMSDVAIMRPVDLVWLASPASSATPGDTPRFGTTSAAGASSARSIPAAAQVPAASSRAGDITVVHATTLDPVLADRLAAEVMRRIDYRARIERERRGL